MRAFLRRFSISLTLLTMAALIPFAASAAVAGDLIKLPDDGDMNTTSDSAVYYLSEDGKRYAFPNSQTFFTWYENFDSVVTVDAGELASYMLGGNVTYRPGTRLVKIQTDPKVYAVEPTGILRWVQTEAIMVSLYGSEWNRRIDDVADTFFMNYAVGVPMSSAMYPSGSIVKNSAGDTYYRIEGQDKRRISDDAVRDAMRIQDTHILTESDALNGYSNGFDITGLEAAITDTSQVSTEAIAVPPTFYLEPLESDFIALGTDSTLLELHVSSGVAVSVNKLTVKITATTDDESENIGVESGDSDPGDADAGGLVYGNNAQANFVNIRFEDAAGNAVFGTKNVVLDIAQDQEQTFTFTGAYAVPANSDKTLKLVAQMNSLLPTGEGYKVTVLNSGVEISGANAFLPDTDLEGATVSTLSEAMQVKGVTGIDNKEYVRGAIDAEVGRLLFEATTAAPNVIQNIVWTGYIDEQEGGAGFLEAVDEDNGTETRVRTLVPSVSLYAAGEGSDEDEKLAGPVDVTFDGKASFSSLAFQILAGESRELILKGDIPAGVYLEMFPDMVAFDVNDASQDMVVEDSSGNDVLAVGQTPNGGTSPAYYTEIKEKGTLEFTWTGNTTEVIAGREVKVGTLVLEAEDDGYTVDTVSFRHTGSSKVSMGNLTLKYTDASGAAIEKAGEFFGNNATFTGLGAEVLSEETLSFDLYATVRQKDGGAVYEEVLKVKFGDSETLQFASKSTLEVFDASVFGGTDFTVPQNLASSLVVRFSEVTFALADDSPSGAVYRDAAVEVLRFVMTTEEEGAIRIKKLKFKVSPADAGTVGADNDALEIWADENGDFTDDDDIINLKQVAGENETLIGEGSSARIKFSVVSGGVTDTTPADVETIAGSYGIIEYDLTGSELFFGSGAVITFVVELDISALDQSKDQGLSVQLLGAGDLEWTDIPSGTYTARTGAIGVPLSSTVTVKK